MEPYALVVRPAAVRIGIRLEVAVNVVENKNILRMVYENKCFCYHLQDIFLEYL